AARLQRKESTAVTRPDERCTVDNRSSSCNSDTNHWRCRGFRLGGTHEVEYQNYSKQLLACMCPCHDLDPDPDVCRACWHRPRRKREGRRGGRPWYCERCTSRRRHTAASVWRRRVMPGSLRRTEPWVPASE